MVRTKATTMYRHTLTTGSFLPAYIGTRGLNPTTAKVRTFATGENLVI